MSLAELLRSLESERFYGKLELQYRDGRVELIRQEKTIKPNSTQGIPANGFNNR